MGRLQAIFLTMTTNQDKKCGHGQYYNGNGTELPCPICHQAPIPEEAQLEYLGYEDTKTGKFHKAIPVEGKRKYPQEMLLMSDCPNCGQEVNTAFVEKVIDDILHAERQVLVERVEELTWYRNDEGVTELEENTPYIKVDDIIKIIKER